jgi:hypothetical protein
LAHADYSSTPIWKKLGIKQGSRVLLVHPPLGFRQVLTDGVPCTIARGAADLDVAVLFAVELEDLRARFGELASAMTPAGRLWVAWPKKASAVPTDIGFDQAQGVGLAAGLVDNKSASITPTFQGIQFVRRLRDRPR